MDMHADAHFPEDSACSRAWRMKRWYGTPARSAARLTAATSSPGRRMLTRASLGANSKRVAFMPRKSNRVRSTSATKRSAFRSLFSRGSFSVVLDLRLIMGDLLGMHEPRADGANEPLARPAPQGERHDDVSTLRGA